MSRSILHVHRLRGLTLIEICVVMVIIVVVFLLALGLVQDSMDRAREARSGQQARQIIAAVIAHSSDQGAFYAKEDVGYSSYRTTNDRLGLPEILERGGYMTTKKIWWVDGARPELKQYGNAFAWNRNDSVCGKNVVAIPEANSVAVLWSNYSYTLPSIEGVSEPTTGGPRNASQNYWYYPFRKRRAATFAYADGHVGLVYRAEKPSPTPFPTGGGPVTATYTGGQSGATGGGSPTSPPGTSSTPAPPATPRPPSTPAPPTTPAPLQ